MVGKTGVISAARQQQISSATDQAAQRQLFLPVGDDYFCRLPPG
jgi:hypothetical protein